MPAQLWRMTPREFAAVVAGVQRRRLSEFMDGMSLAWHQAAFARAKVMPDLRKLLRRVAGQQDPPQTPEQLLAIVRRLNRDLGGEEIGFPPELDQKE